MKALLTHTALATALLVTMNGAQAESMDFETSDSDTIVIGATSEKVTIRVTGYKNLSPQNQSTTDTNLGAYYITTSSSVGSLAVTFAPQHEPTEQDGKLVGRIKNGDGNIINVALFSPRFGFGGFPNIDGTTWAYVSEGYPIIDGFITTYGSNVLSAGVYPITLRAALYQP